MMPLTHTYEVTLKGGRKMIISAENPMEARKEARRRLGLNPTSFQSSPAVQRVELMGRTGSHGLGDTRCDTRKDGARCTKSLGHSFGHSFSGKPQRGHFG